MCSTWGSYNIVQQCSKCKGLNYYTQEKPKEPVRNNKQIWRVAKYLFSKYGKQFNFTDGSCMSQWDCNGAKETYYDTAAELLKKMQNFEFTGDDSHDD